VKIEADILEVLIGNTNGTLIINGSLILVGNSTTLVIILRNNSSSNSSLDIFQYRSINGTFKTVSFIDEKGNDESGKCQNVSGKITQREGSLSVLVDIKNPCGYTNAEGQQISDETNYLTIYIIAGTVGGVILVVGATTCFILALLRFQRKKRFIQSAERMTLDLNQISLNVFETSPGTNSSRSTYEYSNTSRSTYEL